MIKTFKIKPGDRPTEQMLHEVEKASEKSVVPDEDCPELSEKMTKAFRSSVQNRNRRRRA